MTHELVFKAKQIHPEAIVNHRGAVIRANLPINDEKNSNRSHGSSNQRNQKYYNSVENRNIFLVNLSNFQIKQSTEP